MAVTKRGKSFREMEPTADLASRQDVTRNNDIEANKALSGGRDLGRPFVPGITSTQGKGLRRKGRRGRSR